MTYQLPHKLVLKNKGASIYTPSFALYTPKLKTFMINSKLKIVIFFIPKIPLNFYKSLKTQLIFTNRLKIQLLFPIFLTSLFFFF